MKINWRIDSFSRIKVGKLEKRLVAVAIATWDPFWREHTWAVEVLRGIQSDMIEFTYKDKDEWKKGPYLVSFDQTDLQFRLWYERTYPLPEGYKRWSPSCEYCGESYDNEKRHRQFCIGWWVFRVDTRYMYPFGVFPATESDRYRREGEVITEMAEFGFRATNTEGKPVYWKHLFKPASDILLKAGYMDVDQYWVKYWVKRERRRAIKPYARIRHLEKNGYSYYSGRGSLVCSVKQIKGKWFCFTPNRIKLPHGFERPSYAVAFYYPFRESMLALLRRYVYESKWPFARSKAYKLTRPLLVAA